MFKVGDYFLSTSKEFSHRTFGEIYQIVEVDGERAYYISDYGEKRHFVKKRPEHVGAEKVPLSNPLNKKLYPNRVEYKGFLVPKNADIENEE